MKKAITITIPEPCHENWDQMTPTEKGKFCGVCTKEVIDFSKSSDEELIKKIGKGKNLCGRFNTSQLNRKLTLERKSRNNLLPYAASLLLPLGLLGGSDALAQGGPRLVETHFTSLGIGSHFMDKSQVIISGFVTNKQGVPVSNAKITIDETGDSVFSKIDGSYRIVCTSGSTLAFTAPNMVIQKSKTGTAHAQLDIVFEEAIQLNILGGLVGIIVEPEETIEGEIEFEEIIEIESEGTKIPKEETLAERLTKGVLGCGLNSPAVETIKPEGFRTKGKFLPVETTIIEEQENEQTNIIISGTITDENSLPLPGVNVIVKGTVIGTQTDFDGNYSIHPEANQTLIFSYLGYETKEVVMSNISNTIDFGMNPDAQALGEMVFMVGGLSFTEDDSDAPETNNSFGYEFPRHDYERKERVEKRRKAKANEVAFQKIKMDKKKAVKAAKKLKRKRK